MPQATFIPTTPTADLRLVQLAACASQHSEELQRLTIELSHIPPDEVQSRAWNAHLASESSANYFRVIAAAANTGSLTRIGRTLKATLLLDLHHRKVSPADLSDARWNGLEAIAVSLAHEVIEAAKR
jgi:hypothetical protein